MAGTREGGLKTAVKNLRKNPNFYKDIGSRGGKNGTTGGFAAMVGCNCGIVRGEHIKANCAGTIGGRNKGRKKEVK